MYFVAIRDRWLAGEAGPPVRYRHHACGRVSHVELRCAHCGQSMGPGDISVLPGPGAAGSGTFGYIEESMDSDIESH